MTLARPLRRLLLPLPMILTAHAAHAQWTLRDQDKTPFPPLEDDASAAERALPKEPAAPEPPASRFGERGEVVVTAASGGANAAGVSYARYDGSRATYLSLSGAIGLDYFVVRGVSVGFDLVGGYGDSKGYGADGSLVEIKSTNVSGGVRLGANLALGDRFSFYPRLTLGLDATHQSETLVSGQSFSVAASPVGATSTWQVGPWLSLFTPILVHPAPHFFVGIGPRLSHSFSHMTGAAGDMSAQPTKLGASFVLGGWWGGNDPAVVSNAVDETPSGRREQRFGDRGTFALTGETDAAALATTYAGTNSSRLSLYVAPGFDYFVVDHVSFGLDFSVSHSRVVGIDTTGAQVTVTNTSVGFAPRVGVDVPILTWLSWYPRAEIGIGTGSSDETSGGSENQATTTRAWVGLEAPVLVHVARHLFAGLGPSVSHDLVRLNQHETQNRATTVGANVLIGGWL